MSAKDMQALAKRLCENLAPSIDSYVCAQYVVQQIKADAHGGTQREWADVRATIEGLARTAKVRIQGDLGDALEKVLREMWIRSQGEVKWSEDLPMQLNLAERPSAATLEFAHDYVNRQPHSGPTPDQVLYAQIMAEPFDGEHWGEGYDEEVREGWTDSDDEDTATDPEDKTSSVEPRTTT